MQFLSNNDKNYFISFSTFNLNVLNQFITDLRKADYNGCVYMFNAGAELEEIRNLI